MSEYINSMQDLRHWVDACICNFDQNGYTITYEEALDICTERMLCWLRGEYGFLWGQEMPAEETGEDLWDFLKEYETRNNMDTL